MEETKTLPPRSEVNVNDTWDLTTLFASDEEWEQAFEQFMGRIPEYEQYRGKLAESASSLADCLGFDAELSRLGERLFTYTGLKTTEDQTNGTYQAQKARLGNASTRADQAASYIRPEILAITDDRMSELVAADELEPYRLLLERMLRFKKYTLGNKEEELLAMQGEMAQAAGNAFRQLLDADLKFGMVTDENGVKIELSNATFGQLLQSSSREVRKAAFHQYYEQFTAHENTMAATLKGSIDSDAYYAKARGYDSALSQALYPDKVPHSVYDNLIAAVRKNLPAVHHYLDVRRRKMNLPDIHQYDTYVPILSELKSSHTWDQAVEVIIEALAPLGTDYQTVLEQGLAGRWCDRYPNKGKQSGAFSWGTFDSDPYIMMNYKPEVLNDVFTLAHEAGHSMHSYYSSKHQPYLYWHYTIFVAEVASTFNEQLLSKHMLERAEDDRHRAYLINTEIDDIRGTIIRQTMFAEFEKITHAMAEAGEPLTVQSFQDVYRKLLQDYFGPEFEIDDELTLECFRIPHFYRAFYVYKYATGLSAAIALSQRVLNGGQQELDDYLGFLKGGCSKFPLDLLRDAGVDMETPQPVDTALAHFSNLVEELDQLL